MVRHAKGTFVTHVYRELIDLIHNANESLGIDLRDCLAPTSWLPANVSSDIAWIFRIDNGPQCITICLPISPTILLTHVIWMDHLVQPASFSSLTADCISSFRCGADKKSDAWVALAFLSLLRAGVASGAGARCALQRFVLGTERSPRCRPGPQTGGLTSGRTGIVLALARSRSRSLCRDTLATAWSSAVRRLPAICAHSLRYTYIHRTVDAGWLSWGWCRSPRRGPI